MSLGDRPQNKPENNKFFEVCRANNAAKSKAARDAYALKPAKCFNPNCKVNLSWDKKTNKFCSSACAARYHNVKRTPESRAQQGKATRATMLAKASPSPKKKIVGPFSKVYFVTCRRTGKLFCTTNKHKKVHPSVSLTDIKTYRAECKFKLNKNDHPELFDTVLITKYGWYSPSNKGNNLKGVCWDHLFPIHMGFNMNVPIEIMTHPANAELVPHKENTRRYREEKAMITYEQLLERIDKWNAGDRNLEKFYKE